MLKNKIIASIVCLGMMGTIVTGCGKSTSGSSVASSSKTSSASGITEEEKEEINDTISNQPVCENTTTKGADEYDQDDIGEHVFTFGHVGAEGCGMDVAGKVLDELISQKTDGKMRIEVYNSGQLGTDESMRYDCIDGAIDFYSSNFQSYETVVPEMAAMCMPFFYNSYDEIKEYLVYNDELFEKSSELMKDAGYKLLRWQGVGWRQLSTNTEIKGIDSFKGLALRIPTVESFIKIWETLGASTTAINSSELFLALQQGMVDGQENPYDQIYTYGFGEVQKYVTNSNHVPYLQTTVMSDKVFEGLTETEKQVIIDAGEEAAEYITDWSEKAQAYYLQALQDDYGMTYIDFDSIEGLRNDLFEKTYEPLYHEIKSEIEIGGGDPSFLDYYITEVRGFELPE